MLAGGHKDVRATARADEDVIAALVVLVNLIGCRLVASCFNCRPAGVGVVIYATQ